MTRLAAVAKPGWFARTVFWLVRRRLGRVPKALAIWGHHRSLLAANGSYEWWLERADALPARLKELVTLKVAMTVGCRFCIDLGTALAHKHGVTEAELMALLDHPAATCFSSLEQRALDYAVAMSGTPMQLADALFETLRADLGPRGMVELTAVIAWEHHRARFNHAMGAVEEGFAPSTVCLLPPRGRAREVASASGHVA